MPVAATQLQNQLRMERAIGAMMRQAEADQTGFEQTVKNALALLEEGLALQTSCLVRFNRDASSISEKYAGSACDGGIDALVSEFVAEFRDNATAPSCQTLLRFASSAARRPSSAIRAPIAAAAIMAPNEQSPLMLVVRPGPRKSHKVDAEALRAIAELFAQGFERRDRLKELNELKTQPEGDCWVDAVAAFAWDVGHDLNNLLAAILGYAEMTFDGLEPHSKLRNYVENIIDVGGDAQVMNNQILSFSRSRRRTIRSFDISSSVSNMLPVLYERLPANVDLRLSLPDRPLHMYGDAGDLQQILSYFSKSAAGGIDGSGEITMALDPVTVTTPVALSQGTLQPGRYVCLSVSNGASGIPVRDVARIFDPFSRLGSASIGIGLELFQVRRVVESWNAVAHTVATSSGGVSVELYFSAVQQDGPLMDDPRSHAHVQAIRGKTPWPASIAAVHS